MAHNGTRYSEEFKRQIVNLHLSGKSVTELANEYDLVEQTIYKWKKLYDLTIKVDENQKLDADIMAVYFATKRRYGAPKIHQELLSRGWHVSLKRVQPGRL